MFWDVLLAILIAMCIGAGLEVLRDKFGNDNDNYNDDDDTDVICPTDRAFNELLGVEEIEARRLLAILRVLAQRSNQIDFGVLFTEEGHSLVTSEKGGATFSGPSLTREILTARLGRTKSKEEFDEALEHYDYFTQESECPECGKPHEMHACPREGTKVMTRPKLKDDPCPSCKQSPCAEDCYW
jgi:hypothetical protein